MAARCIQLNSQQMASMPLQFEGTFRPAGVVPDPVYYPNGISDAIFAVTEAFTGGGRVPVRDQRGTRRISGNVDGP